MNGLLQDLRYAARQLRTSPGFAMAAVLSLTLGIGATTAMFSVVYSILLDPYPYRDAHRMVHVELRDQSDRGPLLVVNGAEYDQLRRASCVDDVFIQSQQTQTLTGAQFPVSVLLGRYSPNLFTYLGVPPLVGREFLPSDAPDGKGSPVAVLSYLFWQRQFAGNPHVVGQTIALGHKGYTVIGVTPPRFTWGDSDVYVPAMPSADPHDYWNSFLKLKPGVERAAATAELQLLVDRFTKDDPKDFRFGRRVAVVTLNQEILGRFSGALTLLFGAVIALLVIGCANVSILLLARGTARQHELAVRASIGASRTRLIRQLLTESVLLSTVGASLGVLLAYRAVGILSSMLPLYSFPHEAAIRVNAPVLAFSAALAMITGILFGVSPAWQLSHPPINELIEASSARHSGIARNRRTHRILIAGQVALTLLLMAGAGAAVKAFLTLTHASLGFDPDRIFTANIALPQGTDRTWQGRLHTNETIRRTVEETPGMASASICPTWTPPFGGFNAKIEIRSMPTLAGAQAVMALVSPQEFTTLRIPLLAGRIFDEAELNRAAHVALVNQTFAKQFLAASNPIGDRVRSAMLKAEFPDFLLAPAPDDWLEIIGVVADVRNDGADHPIKPGVFLPYSFVLPPDVELIARARGNPDVAIQSVKQRLQALNPDFVVNQDHTLAFWLETREWGQGRFIAKIFSLFAVLALALASAGLYSVVSFAVTQRTHEVGIRMALGAPRANILRLVIASTAATLAAGVTLGLALSLALDQIVRAWAGGSPRQPLTLFLATSILLTVATIACVVPAWRAATVDPAVALRHD